MKFLKTYKVFESIDEDIISTVNDMLLELRDNDIDAMAIASKTAFVNNRMISGDWIFVSFRDIPLSQWSDIYGFTDKSINVVINTIDEYLESNGFVIYKDPCFQSVLDRFKSGYEEEVGQNRFQFRWVETLYKR